MPKWIYRKVIQIEHRRRYICGIDSLKMYNEETYRITRYLIFGLPVFKNVELLYSERKIEEEWIKENSKDVRE